MRDQRRSIGGRQCSFAEFQTTAFRMCALGLSDERPVFVVAGMCTFRSLCTHRMYLPHKPLTPNKFQNQLGIHLMGTPKTSILLPAKRPYLVLYVHTIADCQWR
jgi:hypothetical protein